MGRSTPLSALLALVGTLAAPVTAQDLFVETCSLGCTSGSGGAAVSCSLLDIHVNETLRVRFNQPIDPASLNAASFTVLDVLTGTIVAGATYVSPVDAREVVFEPAATYGPGGVTFAFAPNHPYQLRIAGWQQGDPPPLVASVGGAQNRSRLQCAVFTSQGSLGPFQAECVTTPNSVGAGARISAVGSGSVSVNDVVLLTDGLPAATVGLFVLGSLPAYAPAGNGHLCLGGLVARQPVVAASAAGRATYGFDVQAAGAGATVLPGSTWRFQHVYRDVAAGGAGFNASDALRVTFLP